MKPGTWIVATSVAAAAGWLGYDYVDARALASLLPGMPSLDPATLHVPSMLAGGALGLSLNTLRRVPWSELPRRMLRWLVLNERTIYRLHRRRLSRRARVLLTRRARRRLRMLAVADPGIDDRHDWVLAFAHALRDVARGCISHAPSPDARPAQPERRPAVRAMPRSTHTVPTPGLRSADRHFIWLNDNGTFVDRAPAGGRAHRARPAQRR